MKILIDLTSLAGNFSGIERFALCVAREAVDAEGENEYILLFQNEVHPAFSRERPNVRKLVLRGKNKLAFQQLVLPFVLARTKADVYFFPAFPAPFLFFRKNAVTTIHDVGCWDCPEKSRRLAVPYFRLLYWKAALGRKQIVTVSEFSKARITAVLKKRPEEIAVVYNGLSDSFRSFQYDGEKERKAIQDYALPARYILCLSTLEPRKNLRLLVEAYAELLREGKLDADLVLAGRKGWMIDELLSGVEESVTARIRFTGFVQEELLPYVYKNARLFVFPSAYEGFGVPPLEAAAMGVTTIVSDAASLPEVMGEGSALYFRSGEREDLKEKILYGMNMSGEERLQRRDAGRKRALGFDWTTEARKLVSTLESRR